MASKKKYVEQEPPVMVCPICGYTGYEPVCPRCEHHGSGRILMRVKK